MTSKWLTQTAFFRGLIIARLYWNRIEADEIFEKLMNYLPIEKAEIPPRMKIRRPFPSVSKAKMEWRMGVICKFISYLKQQ